MSTPREFPEADARRILSRAIELDAADGTPLSRAGLESVARELGVGPEAVDRAIAEADAHGGRRTQSVAQLRTAWRRILPSLIVGTAAGAFVGLWPHSIIFGAEDGPALLALGFVGLTAFGLIVRYRSREDGWSLQGALLALWTGLGLGLSAVDRAPLSDVWGLCAGGWGMSAVAAIVMAGINQLYSPRTPARTRPHDAT